MILKAFLSQFFKSTIVFFILFFISFFYTNAQELQTEQATQPTKVTEIAIAINDISSESEKLNQRVTKLRAILKPSSEIGDVDSLLANTEAEITLTKDSLYTKIEEMSQRRLKGRMVEWENYRLILKDYQDVLNNRLTDVTEVNEEMLDEIKKWEFTKESLSDDNKGGDIYSNIDTIVNSLQQITKISLVRIDSIFIIQKRLTNIVFFTDEVISEIKRVQMQLQKDYFVFDSPLLWQINKRDSIALDTSNTTLTNSFATMKVEFDENVTSLKDFFTLNKKTASLQLIFLLLIYILLIIIKKQWQKDPKIHTNQVEKETIIILRYPFAATITAGLLISAFFYKSLIPTITEIHIIIILVSTTFLLPRLSTKRFKIFLSLLVIVYLTNILESYLIPQSFLNRIVLLISAITLIYALVSGYREVKKKPKFFLHIKALFKFIVPIYLLFLIGAIVANIVGMARLSQFLIEAILFSTILGIVVYLSVKIITSIFILLIQFINSANTQAFSTLVKVAQKRLKPILFLIGFIVWIIFTLRSFELYGYLLESLNEILLIKWEISDLTISLGGILSFLVIFLVAILLAQLAAAIFQDEWLIKLLPRGVAPAISLMLRIFIISIGFYASLTAAKVPLNQLGFVVGALGVGIGFGLQNVVLNFVAGLILAFERPINLGDTIEVDMEMGVVTNIGIRSSNIKTYSGSEAIIPNGDLISKKVVNWTLTNRDRRSVVLMKTSSTANPEKVIELFNQIATEDPKIFKNPAPTTHFYGFNLEGNLDFSLFYWTTFDDGWSTKAAIALKLYTALKNEGIRAPLPVRRIISED
ncbi:MAG: mechanosensitive ion channel [Draconibacterium sp.]|nr:mechanosensitive ion channel [Draconibacterium sp.]